MFHKETPLIPAVILQFIDTSDAGHNQYIPYSTVEEAKTTVEDYFHNGGDPDYLGIFVDREKGKYYANILQTVTKKLADTYVPVYAIFPGVLKLAMS